MAAEALPRLLEMPLRQMVFRTDRSIPFENWILDPATRPPGHSLLAMSGLWWR
jgi:hypothetical protein